MQNLFVRSAMVALAALMLASCSSQPRYADNGYHGRDNGRYDDNYRDEGYRNPRCETCGTIESIEPVWVNDSRVGGGTVLGAIIGGALGNQVGDGDGRRAATAAGAIAGGVIGHEIEKDRRDQRRGHTISVRLDDGRFGRVTQIENPNLRVGDRVIIRDDRVYALR